MSYLDVPRLHFSGQFRADPSTVNNDPLQFGRASTDPPDYSKIGSWNPFGTGIWQPVNCTVTRAVLSDGSIARNAADDPVVGMSILDAGARAPAKIVDLDPEQQMCSSIWGLQVRVGRRADECAFSGEFSVAAFVDLWVRAASGDPGFAPLGASWQSVLTGVTWRSLGGSPFLAQLQAACVDGLLSIKFNVDGYDGARVGRSGTFGLGRLCGTIGVAKPEEPARFIRGRHLVPLAGQSVSVNYIPAVVSRSRGKITVDLGNSVQSTAPGGPLVKIPPLLVGLGGADSPLRQLGQIDTGDPDWYASTAGVCEVPAGRMLTAEELAALDSGALALGIASDHGAPAIVAREQTDGLYVRADQFVFRGSPGETVEATLHASRFGAPLRDFPVNARLDATLLPQRPGDPAVCVPATATAFPSQVRTDDNGIAKLTIVLADPSAPGGVAPRAGIDGQVYAVSYELDTAGDPTGTNFNGSDFLSILVWNAYPIPDTPTWDAHIEPLFRQYAYLYPVMKSIVDLSDYNSVVKSQFKLAVALALPIDDPNYMPVTRDLSPAKRATLLKWLGPPGSTTPPAKGSPPKPARLRPADLRRMKSGQ